MARVHPTVERTKTELARRESPGQFESEPSASDSGVYLVL
jgi:hypothetical protein